MLPQRDSNKIIMWSWVQVRYATILDNGTVNTKNLAKHGNRAHKMAVEPGSPRIFYSCGEDGVVMHVRSSSIYFIKFCNSSVAHFKLYNTCRPSINLSTSSKELLALARCLLWFWTQVYLLIGLCNHSPRSWTSALSIFYRTLSILHL